GIRMDVAATAEKALQMMKDAYKEGCPYQIAIVDYYLPGLDGLELGEHILRDAKLKQTRLIMLTSTAQKGDAKRCEEAHFSAYLTKPFRADDLLDTLSLLWADCQKGNKNSALFITKHTLQERRHRMHAGYKSHFDAKVLLVEDNHVNQMVAAAVLKKMGCVVDLAGDGLEGIRQAVFRNYDIIFMDCQMPELDGYEATKELRSREAAEKTPHKIIIAMTANAMQGDRELCLKAGMDDYLTKPIREDELFSMLQKWLPERKKVASA
ncbi:MAG: response regulator, partial [Rickettsiales bacterium]